MSITNGYATLADIKTELGITSSTSDTKLELAVEAASRQFDAYTGWPHGFWQDPTVTAQEFYADDAKTVCIPDGISTVTGLIVKTDVNDDGGFAQTLTLNTNYILRPTNADTAYPVQPFTEIRLVDYTGTYFPMWASGRPGVQVTAKFGWPAVPTDIKKACIIQAAMLFKASDAVTGALQLGEGYSSSPAGGGWMNPTARALLERYCKPRVG